MNADSPVGGGTPAGATEASFPVTRWTRVVTAGGDGAEAQKALEEICTLYWYPLYAFARRQGKSPEDAQDLTQGFFEELLEGGGLGRADRQRGRLRSFLLGGMKKHMARTRRRETAGKRGGGVVPLSIDEAAAEARYGREPADADSPDRLFERRWALEILDRVVRRLGAEYTERGQEEFFAALAPALTQYRSADYPALAERLETTPGAVRTALSRMKQRYRELVMREIAETVASPDLVEDEWADLVAALRPRP